MVPEGLTPLAGSPAVTFVDRNAEASDVCELASGVDGDRNRNVREVGEHTARTDTGDSKVGRTVIAILAEQEVLAVRGIGDTGGAAAWRRWSA